MFWAEVSPSVVNAEMPSVVTCTVVAGGSCVAVKVDISVVALLSSALEVLYPIFVVFCVVSSAVVVSSSVVMLVVFGCLVEATTVFGRVVFFGS